MTELYRAILRGSEPVPKQTFATAKVWLREIFPVGSPLQNSLHHLRELFTSERNMSTWQVDMFLPICRVVRCYECFLGKKYANALWINRKITKFSTIKKSYYIKLLFWVHFS